jgi:hypothetical protein
LPKRPEKKGSEPQPPAEHRVLPMEFRVGDRLTDETGDWEVIGRPFTTAAGTNAHVRVRRVSQPETRDLKTWGGRTSI